MPNIEVYGFVAPHLDNIASELAKTRAIQQKIYEHIEELPWADEVVVTIIDSASVDKKFNNFPFFRICSTDMEEINTLISKLEPIGYDMEWLLLTGFKPAKVGKIHGKK